MNGSNLTHQDTFSNPRGTGYSIGGARKTTLSYDAASGRLVGMAAGSDNFAWEYLAGTNLKSKLTYPNAATAEWTYEAERDLISRVKNTVNGNKNVSDVFFRLTSNGIGAHYDYAPFGATTRTHRDSSASFDIVALNPFRFSSEYYDSELDLVYYNYRHYSPSLGRFLSRDPIEEQGGINLYEFVGLIASTPNWDFDDSNCADMVLKALSQLIKSDKPKCKKRQCPRDLLRNNAWITTPTGVKRIVDKIQANNCNRYECVDSLMYRRSF